MSCDSHGNRRSAPCKLARFLETVNRQAGNTQQAGDEFCSQTTFVSLDGLHSRNKFPSPFHGAWSKPLAQLSQIFQSGGDTCKSFMILRANLPAIRQIF